jgi:ATP-binding cassette, subfamily C, bacterial exporter for protease/lipase
MQEARSAPTALRATLAGCRRHLIAAAVFSAFLNLLYIAPTLYMLQVYDRVVPTRGLTTLAFLTLALVLALATLSLLDALRTRLLTRAGVQLNAALAPLVLDAALGRPELPVARQALRDFDAIRAALGGAGALALFDAPWVPIYILACFLVHPWIGAVALAGCALLPLLALANARATRTRLAHAQGHAARSYAAQEALLASADSVRALGMRRAMVARQIRQREAMLAAQTEAGFATGGYLTATKFLRLCLQSLALGLGALLAVDDAISAGAIFASSFLIARALAPIEQLIGAWRPIAQARQSYRNLRQLLDSQVEAPLATRLPPPRGAIALEGVTVLDGAREAAILAGISLRIESGEVIAIVGPSGAGKSTLVRVIAGAQRAERGTVRFDGADAQDWDAELLARHLGYLPQDCALYAGTVAENIARFAAELGEDQARIDAAVIAAAQKVGADALIRQLSRGYDHPLQLRGAGLSAGQAQRVALARAVYGDPAVLILDEPNAHLDAEGDAALVAAIGTLKAEGRTVLIVSHKLGILPVVDRILVLRDGRVELFGSRDEVLPRIAPPQLRVARPAAAQAV